MIVLFSLGTGLSWNTSLMMGCSTEKLDDQTKLSLNDEISLTDQANAKIEFHNQEVPGVVYYLLKYCRKLGMIFLGISQNVEYCYV